MHNFSEISPFLLKIRSCFFLPQCGGRYFPPGTLYRPHHERFDENCERKPLPHPETPRFQGIDKLIYLYYDLILFSLRC